MTKNYYVSGGWNCICDRCGKKKKISEVTREWTGFLVCNTCFEERHSQDFVRARQDKITIPFNRPRPTDLFIDSCSLTGRTAYTGLAIAGCSITGFDDDSWKQYLGL